jgi:hypothetical protein
LQSDEGFIVEVDEPDEVTVEFGLLLSTPAGAGIAAASTAAYYSENR